MARCGICGRDFDPFAYQVVVPELGTGFDKLECARQARGSSRVAPEAAALLPFATVIEPLPAASAEPVPLAAAVAARPPLATTAYLGGLAAGAAAAAYLWLRVFSGDPSSSSLPDAAAPPAVERQTIPAQVSLERAAQREASGAEATSAAAAGPIVGAGGETPAGTGGSPTTPGGSDGSGSPGSGGGGDGGDGDGDAGGGGGGRPSPGVASRGEDNGKHKGWTQGQGHFKGNGKGHEHHDHGEGGGEDATGSSRGSDGPGRSGKEKGHKKDD